MMESSKSFLLLLFLSVTVFVEVESKIYGRCEFVKKLKSLGVPPKQLGTWTCIGNYESHFNTKAVNPTTGDYGILQISHLYWCSNSNSPGGGCNITCRQLLGDDIRDDVKCARHIFDVTKKQTGNGFSAWTTYRQHCSGNNDQWIKNC